MNDKVRQAICYAIDKDAINKSVYDGMGTPTSEYMPHDYVPTQPSTGFTTYEYNPEKAKELLKEAVEQCAEKEWEEISQKSKKIRYKPSKEFEEKMENLYQKEKGQRSESP